MSGKFSLLADLFRYPASPLDVPGEKKGHLADFAREIALLDQAELQATYTSTFDLAPSCSPYVGEHLFGEAGPDRGRLLVGLRSSYRKAGIDFDERELPDHIAEVLAFVEEAEEEERTDLVRLILIPALTKMDGLLREQANPYRHLVAAAREASESTLAEGGNA